MPDPIKVIARILRLAQAAKKSKRSVAIEDALDGAELAEWERLVRDMKRIVSSQPS